jgi:hypothetical protein
VGHVDAPIEHTEAKSCIAGDLGGLLEKFMSQADPGHGRAGG